MAAEGPPAAGPGPGTGGAGAEAAAEAAFRAWLRAHPRGYATRGGGPAEGSGGEWARRLEVFRGNREHVAEANAAGRSYTLALNDHADLTDDEFAERFGLRGVGLPLAGGPAAPQPSNGTLPAARDWRAQGAVTAVKTQGACGACWAFAAVGAVEGISAIRSGTLVELSEQQIIDCAPPGAGEAGASGCRGGSPSEGLQFIARNGVTTEDRYAYEGRAGSCREAPVLVNISGWTEVAPGQEALKRAVAMQPVATSMRAGVRAVKLYKEGILTDEAGECVGAVDHGVVVVGYGEESGTPFWTVKNSWGEAWGEGGYIRLARQEEGPGVCNVATQSFRPLKNDTWIGDLDRSDFNDDAVAPCRRIYGRHTVQVPVIGTVCLETLITCFSFGAAAGALLVIIAVEVALHCDGHRCRRRRRKKRERRRDPAEIDPEDGSGAADPLLASPPTALPEAGDERVAPPELAVSFGSSAGLEEPLLVGEEEA